MINVKKGVAKSLQQTDLLGTIVTGQGIVAGMICRKHTDGTILKGGSTTGIMGFAIQNQADGDVVDSGKLSLYALDGASVIETDQSDITINSSNYAIGAAVYATTGNTGTVTTATTVNRIIGYVEGIRQLPYTDTVSGMKVWTTKAFLGIKLAA